MTIEQEIQSSNFAGEDHKLAINLLLTGSWFEALINKHFATFGVSTPQHNVLRILRGTYPEALSIGNVQQRMVDKASNITRLALKLREKGYVVQHANSENRRIQELRITKIGLDFLNEVEQHQHRILSEINHLDITEMQQLNLLLDKVRTKATD